MKTCNTTYRKKISMKKGRVFTIAKYSMRERELEHLYIYRYTMIHWVLIFCWFYGHPEAHPWRLNLWIFESLWSTGSADSQVPSSCSIWGLPQVLLGNFTTLAAMRVVVTAENLQLCQRSPQVASSRSLLSRASLRGRASRGPKERNSANGGWAEVKPCPPVENPAVRYAPYVFHSIYFHRVFFQASFRVSWGFIVSLGLIWLFSRFF